MKELLEYRLLEFQNYTLTVAALLGVVTIYIITLLILRFFRRLLAMRKTWDGGRRHSFYLLLQYVIWVLAGTAMLETVGIKVTVLVAGSAALLVGLGLGVQQIFKDIVSGIFLLFEGSIEVGDVMEVDGKVGRVQEINLRTSQLLLRDGIIMIVPNHKFITENVTNWSHGTEQPSRFQVTVSVSYDSNETLVRNQLIDCALEHADILKDDPARQPNARLINFGDSALVFELLFWTYRKFDVDNIKSEIRFAILQKFREQSIQIPYPQTEMTIKQAQDSAATAFVKPKPEE